MRYMVLAGVLAFALCAGVCEAEDGKVKNASTVITVKTVEEETESGAGLKHIGLGDNPEDRAEEPVAEVGVMSPGESYDENTGFPDVVESDSDMELQ